ncbi:MAG TPA: M23 family metallopeptidase [Candidatus Acidoferrum sp.]|nr:M23 family metallopeptidase [Candidatus Acidoferrum sp.]
MGKKPLDKRGTLAAAIILVGAFLAGGGAYLAVRDAFVKDTIPEPEPFRLEVPETELIEEPTSDVSSEDLVAVPQEPVEPDETEEISEEPEEEPATEVSSTPASADTSVKQLYIKPVDGTVTKPWSGEDLVWSETLGDYRVHTGCDIAATAGSKVRAMADGEISDIYYDDLLGYCIEIDHGNGVITRYCNLLDGQVAGIEVGAKVKMGDVISGVGETALMEAAEGPHLHLEVLKDGVRENPQEFFK